MPNLNCPFVNFPVACDVNLQAMQTHNYNPPHKKKNAEQHKTTKTVQYQTTNNKNYREHNQQVSKTTQNN